jgi:Exopolyphosphatase-related proteins
MAQKGFSTERQRAEALGQAAEMLRGAGRVLILSHKSPDGDTMGSAFALCRAVKKLGKAAAVVCSDPFPAKYGYLHEGLQPEQFEPDLVVASDIATTDLFGKALEPYAGRVDLCIDHHPSNTGYAAFSFVDPRAAATCEIMAELIEILGVEIDKDIANCLYTGLATDTGCFCYSSTTPKTLRTAADLIEKGADSIRLNKLLFETKSRGRLHLEALALASLEYHFGGLAALIVLSKEMMTQSGVDDAEAEGIPSIPARIEGVVAGITIKEKDAGVYKISLRTGAALNASDICARLGGGGHAAAAGCSLEGPLGDVKRMILDAVGKELGRQDVKGETK